MALGEHTKARSWICTNTNNVESMPNLKKECREIYDGNIRTYLQVIQPVFTFDLCLGRLALVSALARSLIAAKT